MNDTGLALQISLLLIRQWGGESRKKKDVFACILLGELGILAGMTFSVCLPLLKWIRDYFILLEKAFNDISNGIYYVVPISAPTMLSWHKILLFGLIMTIPAIIILLLKIKRSLMCLIFIVIQLVASIYIFDQSGYVLMPLAVCLFMINIFIPFGSGTYFNAIKYICYFPEVYCLHMSCKDKKHRLFPLIILFIKIIISLVLFLVSAKLLFPICSLDLLLMLYAALAILILMNYSRNKVQRLIQKFIAYSIIALLILANNNSFQDSLIGVILAVVSIFFAIDRVISLFKDCKRLVKEDSLNYLIDEVDEDELLLKEKLDISHLKHPNLPESILLRQIVIHSKLGLPSTATLIQAYRDLGYDKDIKLINSIEFLEVIDENTPLEEQEKMSEKIWSEPGTEYVPLSIHYAYVLFFSQKEYQKIIDILEHHWLYLSEESKYILYFAFINVNNLSAAKTVKKEMTNFEQIKKTLNEALKEYNDKDNARALE